MKLDPTPSKKGGSGNTLLDALKEVESDRQKKLRDQRRAKKLDRWFGWFRRLPGGVKVPLLSVAGIFVVLVGDGLRREGQELSARIAEAKGQVTVLKAGATTATPAKANLGLGEKDAVFTGPDGEATVAFPDGSAILVEPGTKFEVRLLGFSRGDVRDRSFLVQVGSVVANFSRQFGKGSRGSIATPTAVAAVRGTGFRVYYDPAPSRKQTYVAVVEGTVAFRNSSASAPVPAGQVGVADAVLVQPMQPLSQAARQRIQGQVDQLKQYDKPPGLLDGIEKSLVNALNPLLQLLGIMPGGWGYQAVDAARLTATRQQLRVLATELEAAAGNDVPDTLNLVTLEELQLSPRDKENILKTLEGGMLESYRKTGRNQYVIRARARDKAHTLFEVAPGGVNQVQE